MSQESMEHMCVTMVKMATTMMGDAVPQELKDLAIKSTEQVSFFFLNPSKITPERLAACDSTLTQIEQYDMSSLIANDREFITSNTTANREAWSGF